MSTHATLTGADLHAPGAHASQHATGDSDPIAAADIGAAPAAATYITQTANAGLSAEQALGALATGILKSTTTTGVVSIAVADTDYATPGLVTAHTGDTTAAHAASAISFTPNGSIAATDVQAAIQEVRDEAGGGGDLLSTNNLSDLDDVVEARDNLGVEIGVDVQGYDADLAAIAALSPTNDDIIQRKVGAWTNRTMAQLKTDLALNNVDNTSDATKNAAAVTLTNKTLTTPIISSISNTGTLTLPTSTDTIVGRATTDTLTNKTLTTPTIGDFTNATHTHQNAAGGGTLDAAAVASGVLAIGRLATGTPNGSKFVRDDGTLAVPAGTASVAADPIWDAAGDLVQGTGADTAARLAIGTDGYKLASTGSAAAWEVDYAALAFVIDGGGSAITTGVKGDLEVPFACVIDRVTMLADQSGSIVVDIWKDTYTNYPPVVGDSITASAKPTITTATKSQDSTLTGWTTTVAAGDTLRFNVDSITTCQRVLVSLRARKT